MYVCQLDRRTCNTLLRTAGRYAFGVIACEDEDDEPVALEASCVDVPLARSSSIHTASALPPSHTKSDLRRLGLLLLPADADDSSPAPDKAYASSFSSSPYALSWYCRKERCCLPA